MRKGSVLSTLLGTIIGTVGGAVVAGNITGKNADKWRALSDKNLALFLLMNKWIKTKHEGKHIRDYFAREGYKTAAIYGLSHVGERLLEELKDCGIEVRYAIDRNAATIYSNVEVYLPEDDLPKTDVLIVTAVYFYDEIYNNLKDKVACPIVSLDAILYSLDKS